jgi:hypothetical protein
VVRYGTKAKSPPSHGPAKRAREGGIRTPMAIIWPCPLTPSSYAAAGPKIQVPPQLCPGCRRRLTGWGGYWRWVRAAPDSEPRIWIRRGRCPRCRRTHALLPSFLFVHRLDAASVIGSGLELAADGRGARRVARELALPHTTVRDWWRRLCARAPMLLASALALATSLDPAPVDLTGDGAPAVVEAVASAWQRAERRLAGRLPDRWSFWSVMSGGLALAPHTVPPLPG